MGKRVFGYELSEKQLRILVAVAVFLSSFAIPFVLPGFLRTDPAGDALLEGLLMLIIWIVATCLFIGAFRKQ